jgi:hypothetical protein
MQAKFLTISGQMRPSFLPTDPHQISFLNPNHLYLYVVRPNWTDFSNPSLRPHGGLGLCFSR